MLGEQIGTLSGHKVAVGSLNFINEGHHLVSLGYDQTIKVWDANQWRELQTIQLNVAGVRGMVLSPNEKLAAISMESKVQLWLVAEWRLQAELPISTKAVGGMAFSPDGRWLAVGAANKKIRIWKF